MSILTRWTMNPSNFLRPSYSSIRGRTRGALSSVKYSSASVKTTQSPCAWSSAKFFAAAKSLIQSKWQTRAPPARAISTVASVDPVSTTIISLAKTRMDASQRGRFSASFLAMTHAEIFIVSTPLVPLMFCARGRVPTPVRDTPPPPFAYRAEARRAPLPRDHPAFPPSFQ